MTSTLGIATPVFLRHPDSLLAGPRQDQFLRDYKLLVDRAHLASPDWAPKALLSAANLAGIYLWTVRPGKGPGDKHVVYVGRTNDLGRRLKEYLRGFQPHSVNDYKLQVFQESVLQAHDRASFALYFKEVLSGSLSEAESKAIALFRPVLNQRLKPPGEAQLAFRKAFEQYYAAGFAPFLAAKGDV